MTLSDALENYQYHTGKMSEVLRQLSFAGIAIIWLFRRQVENIPKIPADLQWPAVLIVLGLTFDLLHYASGSLIWGIYHRYREKKFKNEDDFLAPKQINWLTLTFFWGKTVCVVAAYILLLMFLGKKLL